MNKAGYLFRLLRSGPLRGRREWETELSINKAMMARAISRIGLGVFNLMTFVLIVIFLYYTFETAFSSLLSEI